MVPAILRIQQSALQIRGSRDIASSTLLKLGGKKIMQNFDLEIPEFNCNHQDFKPLIQVSNLGFRYPGNSNFQINDLNFQIKFGDVVAIVGPSGGGKSTLIDLMLGIIPSNEGQVQYDNLKPSQAISKFPGSIAYVPQDIQIVNGTLQENIGLGYKPSEISPDQYEKVLEIAQLTEFVSNLKKGLDTQIGDMGNNLSGGQKQRIGIARALITNPRVIVLDEATSALDNDTENEFNIALMKLKKQATIIIIAHRLSTVREADQIIYIEKGNLIASGTLDSVMEKIPAFKKNLNSILK
jgi:ABC-type bacteriocin/lantibiotic exporter with double-glycine peptidase domain